MLPSARNIKRRSSLANSKDRYIIRHFKLDCIRPRIAFSLPLEALYNLPFQIDIVGIRLKVIDERIAHSYRLDDRSELNRADSGRRQKKKFRGEMTVTELTAERSTILTSEWAAQPEPRTMTRGPEADEA